AATTAIRNTESHRGPCDRGDLDTGELVSRHDRKRERGGYENHRDIEGPPIQHSRPKEPSHVKDESGYPGDHSDTVKQQEPPDQEQNQSDRRKA
ncbi:MAG: hypothetical protein ACJ740_00290, partial [Gaiellales bacterium]